MSDAKANKQPPAPAKDPRDAETNEAYRPESQAERRLKYGLTVALSCLLVIALVTAVIYLAERKPKRFDTTASGFHSLSPQTVNLIKENKEKIKIISFYSKSSPPASATAEDQFAAQRASDEAQVVSDLLDEYRNKGTNISVETIDPIANPARVDDLIAEVIEQYGGQVQKYKAFTDTYQTKTKKLGDLAAAEYAKISKLTALQDKLPTPKDQIHFAAIRSSLYGTKGEFQHIEEMSHGLLRDKPPGYKVVTDKVRDVCTALSVGTSNVTEFFDSKKDEKTYPEPLRAYMAESIPRYQEIKKAADAILEEIKGLGELKLDTLHEALQQSNSILVRGENDWKMLPHDQVWRLDEGSVRSQLSQGGIRPQFAGEQMISTAILALEHPKKLKVVFVRAGGNPMTEPPSPAIPDVQKGHPAGHFFLVAQHLLEYNYEVLEKDLTGMYAVHLMQAGQPPPREPSDQEISDAVWVVVPGPRGSGPGGASATIAPKVLQHLASGGSALIVAAAMSEDLSLALHDWGIEIHPEAVAVHERIDADSAARPDEVEKFKMRQFIFDIRDWGDSAVTSTMRSLPGVLPASTIVKVTQPAAGIKSSQIIPIPGEPSYPRAWGETDFTSAFHFDKDKDFAEPIFAGAVAESDKGGRVVVVGTPGLFINENVAEVDEELLSKQRIEARLFPGNGELFMNSIFWLSHQDPMIAISPSAMDVSRIGEISPTMQKVWRIGVLLIGMPCLVLLAGGLVYLSRRD